MKIAKRLTLVSVALCCALLLPSSRAALGGNTVVNEEDFEGALSTYWSKKMNSNWYAGKFSSAHAVSPSHAYRFELRSTDPLVGGEKRAELQGQIEPQLEERTYDFNIFLPSGTEDYATDNRDCEETLVRWENNPDTGEAATMAPLALITTTKEDGKGHYTLRSLWDDDAKSTDAKLKSEGKISYFDLGSYEGDKGKWVKWSFRVKWGWLPSHNPKLEVYKNGTLVLEHNGYPNMTNDTKGVDQQFGLYKWEWDGSDPAVRSKLSKRVVYFDDMKVTKVDAASNVVSTPAFSPASGTYTASKYVTISTATADATIYYTQDGTAPTAASSRYTGPITVSSTKTIKAIAIKSGMTDSAVGSATYTISAPDTTLPAISITSPTAGQTLYAASLTVAGTASDNASLSQVEVKLNSGSYQAATGKESWSMPLTLVSGSNTITARATDAAGNTKTVSVTVTYEAGVIVKYPLTVHSGTGDGSYASGAEVAIKAATAPAGKVFDKWTGDVAYVSGVNSATATVTMPAKAVTLTANYQDAAITKYPLSVLSGTGDGSYTSGAQVAIKAATAPAGKVFDKWTGDTSYLDSVNSATATVTMPAKSITLTATYKDASSSDKMYYLLIVNSGSGSDSYEAGSRVEISANMTISELVFEKWTGDTQYLDDPEDFTTYVTMPAKHISVTATFKNSPDTYTLTVNSGAGDGSFAFQDEVTVIADNPQEGKIFDRWTGDTEYLEDPLSARTTVNIPRKAITLTATYREASSETYALTVNSGSGSGQYAPGTQVFIRALPQVGKTFERWMGDTAYVSDPYALFAKVNMPEKAITLSAIYRGADGTGGGNSTLANGTLIKLSDNPKVYVIISGKKKWISTPEVFEQLGYKWTSIQTVTKDTLDSITDLEDNLIRIRGDFKIYLVVNGTKRHIPNPDIFLDYGFLWEDVKDVDAAGVDRYKNTYLIRESKQNAIFYLSPNGVRKHIPTAAIFNSYHDKWEDVQIISKTEMESYPISNLIQLEGSGEVYLIEGVEKRLVSTPEVFKRNGYDWSRVIKVNRAEFDYYKTGKALK